ncbi:MAG TPA: CpsB/CapC family capsule biosynthesis tyrosine phosphatase [Tepidisphaeraceae bacterium]|nr:CpsB/CapC family capsule biosynthesis tyrosine phosphatase [Tepidisphaeraceae bacterium]
MATGRIDVHAHLIPGVDDGCKTYGDSIACARELVAAGYTHAFCTPHVWPSYDNVRSSTVPGWTRGLQEKLDEAQVPLKVMPGGELNLHEGVRNLADDHLITYGIAGRYLLADMWAAELPEFFTPTIRFLQSRGYTVILAHPERMRAVQDRPDLADVFADLGVLLQGNLQCFGDPPDSHTRRVAEQFLLERRYFMLGSDTHNPQSMAIRTNGLRNAIALAGEDAITALTIDNPRKLISL